MRSTVEVRVAIVHDIDPHENHLIMEGLKRMADMGDIATYEISMIRDMLDSMGEIAVEAERTLGRMQDNRHQEDMPVRKGPKAI